MIENIILELGSILFNGYLISVILNVFLTPKFFIDKLKVQNCIGILFCIGI